ncbi:uncharacterized protein LOC115818311 [Chanos chanos]|uniref:Uncharacterized protein LOC115818311 n=1 Tax=Chanos chanos TaxID=29144 RepID=A0A6J2W032_CHACN|nr:uncharacterized protein LOC115818311 [Chanos chanos]
MVAGMVMPLDDLKAIYERLFRDGVMVAKKDKRPQTKHPEIPGVRNLQVIRAMGSLKSRGYVRETFAWRHFYWYLTNEGIVYLRDYLHLPPEIVPTPLQRVRRPAATLAIAHRAARVQAVAGPTSYVPKPVSKSGADSQAALMERQAYRHKRVGASEDAVSYEMTPRFRGRPIRADKSKPEESWESRDHGQSILQNGQDFPKEMEQSWRRDRPSHLPPLGACSAHSTPDKSKQENVIASGQRGSMQMSQDQKNDSPRKPKATSNLPAQLTAVATTIGAVAAPSEASSSIKAAKEKPKKEVSMEISQSASKTSKETITNKPAKDVDLPQSPEAKMGKTLKKMGSKTAPEPATEVGEAKGLKDDSKAVKFKYVTQMAEIESSDADLSQLGQKKAKKPLSVELKNVSFEDSSQFVITGGPPALSSAKAISINCRCRPKTDYHPREHSDDRANSQS